MDYVNGSDSDSDIEILMSTPLSATPKHGQVKLTMDINELISQFKEKAIDESVPCQLFTVCRSDGIEEMKGDILSYYKNPQTNLLARMRVRFEGEEGLGAGPVREFLHHAVKLVEYGIGSSNKPIGRIVGHSFLHDLCVVMWSS